ncbi:MAG TPA: hypothetical protein VM754_11455 [Actinomycetota bacterium]|nr:hypothetical protein [Actinomycetota bacterium]
MSTIQAEPEKTDVAIPPSGRRAQLRAGRDRFGVLLDCSTIE